jgi:hypothetical protein
MSEKSNLSDMGHWGPLRAIIFVKKKKKKKSKFNNSISARFREVEFFLVQANDHKM